MRSFAGRDVFFDSEGFLVDPSQWSEEMAELLARESGIDRLEETHWQVIRFIREYYLQNGRAPLHRELKKGIGMSLDGNRRVCSREESRLGARLLAGSAQSQKLRHVRENLAEMIYLDNAATTFPKPREVLERMIDLYAAKGVSPGRGGYDCAQEADELVSGVRKRLCQFFGGDDPDRVIFASNATDALNLVIQGAVKSGGHVVSSQLEHNSVLRPLQHLRESGSD